MLTTKQKPIVGTQKIKLLKHTTKESDQTTKERKRRKKEQKKQITRKRFKKWQ